MDPKTMASILIVLRATSTLTTLVPSMDLIDLTMFLETLVPLMALTMDLETSTTLVPLMYLTMDLETSTRMVSETDPKTMASKLTGKEVSTRMEISTLRLEDLSSTPPSETQIETLDLRTTMVLLVRVDLNKFKVKSSMRG